MGNTQGDECDAEMLLSENGPLLVTLSGQQAHAGTPSAKAGGKVTLVMYLWGCFHPGRHPPGSHTVGRGPPQKGRGLSVLRAHVCLPVTALGRRWGRPKPEGGHPACWEPVLGAWLPRTRLQCGALVPRSWAAALTPPQCLPREPESLGEGCHEGRLANRTQPLQP